MIELNNLIKAEKKKIPGLLLAVFGMTIHYFRMFIVKREVSNLVLIFVGKIRKKKNRPNTSTQLHLNDVGR